MSNENKRYNVVFPIKLIDKLKERAEERNITYSALIRMILTEWLLKHPAAKNTAAINGEL